MAVSVFVDDAGVLVGLGDFNATVSDKNNLMSIARGLMLASIIRTFKDEGSPAKSWVRLAASTLKKKGYTAGHQLLRMRGHLWGSITSVISGGVLTIGTNIPYAAVHQFGSKDRLGGSIGAQARIAGRSVGVREHSFTRAFKQYGSKQITDKLGRSRNVRVRNTDKIVEGRVGAHERFQNIPARPYMVFRPEDPENLRSAFEAYLGGRAVSIGKVGA
jgi:phage gpG-like protein